MLVVQRRLGQADTVRGRPTARLHPEGEWVGMESGGWAAAHGVGLAETTLHDERGLLGRAAQTLLVSPIGDGGGRPGFAPEDSPPQP